MVSGKFPARKIAIWLGLGFGLGLELKVELGSNFRRGHCPGASISEQFPSGPIVLEPLKSNSFFYLALKYNSLL